MFQATRRYTVNEHFNFDPLHPERFDWSLVLNEKERNLVTALAAALTERRSAWIIAGKEGLDPLIPGMREALRVLASQLVWRVSVDRQAEHGHSVTTAGER